MEIERLQNEVSERVKTLDPDQLRQILESFKHRERFEAYPDLFIHTSKGVVVYGYELSRGQYAEVDSKTFSTYQAVVPLTREKQLCFGKEKADVLEKGKVKSSQRYPSEVKIPLEPYKIFHINKKIVCTSINSSRIYVFSENGILLSFLNTSGIGNVDRFGNGIALSLFSAQLRIEVYIIEENKLELFTTYSGSLTALLFGEKGVLVNDKTIRLFRIEDNAELSTFQPGGLDSAKLTDSRFAVYSAGKIRIFDILGDSIILTQSILGFAVPPLLKVVDDMFVSKHWVFKLENNERYRQIQSNLPIEKAPVNVGFIPSSLKKKLEDFLDKVMTKTPTVVVTIVVGFIA